MSFRDKLKPILQVLKVGSYCGSVVMFIAYHIHGTRRRISSVVNSNVLDREKKHIPEYIYIDDPSYGVNLRLEQDRESRRSIGLFRIWKSLKHSLAWRLLWLCRHGNRDQRNIALEQLAAFKNNKHWDCLKLAQAMDKKTAVLLARTNGADLRYFLPPPIHVRRAALRPELLSFKLMEMLAAVQSKIPHSCVGNFLSKYYANVQEQAMEQDSVPSKPDNISERDLCLLCLDAIHHHLSLYYSYDFSEDEATQTLVKMGLIPCLGECFLRNNGDCEVDLALLRILTVLSIHCPLLQDFFQNGLIRELSRLIRSKDVRLASSAAVCLSNLSGECCYRPGLYLLHPLYRTRNSHTCDLLLVHGLRGGVFVTWRQRDKKCAEPLGIIEVTISSVDSCDARTENTAEVPYLDPELNEVIEELKQLEEQSLLSDYEVVLHDIPTEAKREHANMPYTAHDKYLALTKENQDRFSYTYCWPKDWLPKDCDNLRILGVNYWSTLSEWLERCPLQTADISVRAADLAPSLVDAGVGVRDTPVVWLSHSMGGLIVKQMLTDAAMSDDPTVSKLCANTKAVLFYSTPHKGSALATMPRPAAAILWPSNDVRQLQENSPVLLDLHQAFMKYADAYGWETISFAETMPTLVTAFKVPVHFVEANSADLGRGVFYELPLDHLCICKPATRQSILYTTILDVLKRVTAKDIELRYTNPFVQWLLNWLWWFSNSNASKGLDKVDENTNSETLRWYEKMLLDTFTDF
ncbi:protein SERAC1-like [Pectinophora gossypiella]|nr:protein SERAC1-like [Pectinophora gossypiella]